MNSFTMNLKIKFTSPILGSQPGKDTPASDFIRSKVKDKRPDLDIEDETGTLPEELQKGTTGFNRDKNGDPCYLNYHVKGMMKEAASVLNGIGNFKGLKSKIDNLVFIDPRIIPIHDAGEIGFLERPLRAMTMQGPRTSICRSEMIGEGAWIECQIKVIESPKVKLTRELIEELLEYAQEKGWGQWRNSGYYGRFEYEIS